MGTAARHCTELRRSQGTEAGVPPSLYEEWTSQIVNSALAALSPLTSGQSARCSSQDEKGTVPCFAVRAGGTVKQGAVRAFSGPEIVQAEGDRIERTNAHRLVVLRALRAGSNSRTIAARPFASARMVSRVPSFVFDIDPSSLRVAHAWTHSRPRLSRRIRRRAPAGDPSPTTVMRIGSLVRGQ